jgi:uncharacterized protein
MKYFVSIVFFILLFCFQTTFAQQMSKSIKPLHESLWFHFKGMFVDRTFIVTALGWLTACFLKILISKLKTGQFHFEKFFATGGMPSSHSAFASALTMGIGISEGFDSAVFGLSLGLTILTAVDAVGLRKEAGLQAECLNQIISEMYKDKQICPEKLRETLGHTLPEVLAGILVGSGTAFAMYYLLPQ